MIFITNNTHKSEGFQEAVRPDVVPVVPELTRSTDFNFDRDKKIKEYIKQGYKAYLVDGIIKQSVDRFVEGFGNVELEGDLDIVKRLETRLEVLSLKSNTTWKSLIYQAITDYVKVGNAFLVKFRSANANYRPLYKDNRRSIEVLRVYSAEHFEPYYEDDYFVGWKLDISKIEKFKTNLSREVSPESGFLKLRTTSEPNVLVPNLDVLHLAYRPGSDSKFGQGITFPGLEDVTTLRQMELTTAINVKKYMSPTFQWTIGRPGGYGTNMSLQNEINQARQLAMAKPLNGFFITPEHHKITPVGAESHALRAEGYLNIMTARAAVGAGTSAFLLGLQAGSIGTVESNIKNFIAKINFCRNEIVEQFQLLIYELLWELGYDPFNNPKHRVSLKFSEVDMDQVIKFENHQADLVNKNFLEVDEGRERLKISRKINKQKMLATMTQPPKPPGAKSKESVERVVKTWIPSSFEYEEDFEDYITYLGTKFGIKHSELRKLYENAYNLKDDQDALVEFLVENIKSLL